MTIADFNKIALQSTTPNMVVGQGNNQHATLREPLNPPGAWTKFKAALSSLPVLGHMGSLQRARQEVDSYPVRLAQYEVSNRQILAGFVQDLRQNFGERVANMAMRNVEVTDGAPLSQRMVKTAIDSAEQAQKQQRAMNNMQITRFLENPLQGGARLPGEVDMNALYLERNMPLNGQPSWQQALSTHGAKFVGQLSEGLCRSLPDHSRQALTNEQIATAANQALDTYQSLLATPDMTPARLEGILMQANEKSASGYKVVLERARELVITDRLDTQIDRKNAGSLLNRIALAVQTTMKEDIDALELPPPGLNLAPVLKSIANGISETVSFGMRGLARELGCSDDTPSLARALDAVVPTKIEAAVREHIQALRMIQLSETLTEGQKSELMAIANTRRIDPVQVQKYEAIAAAVSRATTALQSYAQGGADPQTVLGQLEHALGRFETDLGSMKQFGATLWEQGSLSGGDMTTVLMQQFTDVAARNMGPEEARALLPLLMSPEVGTLAQVMQESSDLRTAGQLPIVLMSLLISVAQRAGKTPEEAETQVKALFHQPEGGLELGHMRPSLALMLLTDPERTDDRGVARGSPNAGLVAQDFDARQIFTDHRQNIQDYVNSDGVDGNSGLPKTTIKDMGRVAFNLNNQRIGAPRQPGHEVLERFQSAFASAPMARGVARCMNQLGINMFVELSNSSAYGESNTLGNADGAGHTTHEAWQQGDGSWLVRSTHTQRPGVLAAPDGTLTMIESSGLAVFSLTYRVAPGTTPEDEAVITLEDSQVSYAI